MRGKTPLNRAKLNKGSQRLSRGHRLNRFLREKRLQEKGITGGLEGEVSENY